MEKVNEMPIDGQLAMRILNFVSPYIPDHVREESLELIKNETRKPARIEANINKMYAETTIRWKDDDREEEVIIAIGCPYIEKYDEQILFYCDNKEDFESLKHYENGQDFVIIGCTNFFESLD